MANEPIQQTLSDLEALHDKLVLLVRTCSDADWSRRTAAEGRTIGEILSHIGDGYSQVADLADRSLSHGAGGHPAHAAPPAVTDVGREDLLRALDERYQGVVSRLQGLSRQPAEASAHHGADADAYGTLLVRHTLNHLSSVFTTLEATAEASLRATG